MTPLEESLNDLENIKSKMQTWWDAQSIALSCGAKFPSISSVTCKIPERFGSWHGIFIHVQKVKSLDDLKPIFRFLGKHGYLHKGKPDIYEEIHRVSWDFGEIKLLAFFTEDEGSNCRFVKVKTEAESYKLICPDIQG